MIYVLVGKNDQIFAYVNHDPEYAHDLAVSLGASFVLPCESELPIARFGDLIPFFSEREKNKPGE